MTNAGGMREGEVFAGRYRILEHLGDGGMGSVYRVEDELLEEVVALKVVSEAAHRGTDADDVLAAQRREVSMARRVTHPNVARVFDLGTDDGRLYITMEYVPGSSLRQRLVRGRLAVVDLVAIGLQVASALVAAHDAGVLHLDLKPDNVLVIDGTTPRAVLIDFGIARAFGAHALGTGTPDFMSPEQLEDKPLGGAVDVYALGLILYELAVGERPFPGKTSMERVTMRLFKPAPELPLPDEPDLAALVRSCLARNPADRPDARSLARGLARIAAEKVGAPSKRELCLARGHPDLGSLPGGLGARLARARRRLTRIGQERDVVAEIDAVLAEAPELVEAVSIRALAMVRLWNRSFLEPDTADVADAAVEAVARATAVAPHLADTHLADALIADYSGDVAYAVRALRRALDRDPLHAFSHEVLGRIELEAGLDSDGRVELAHALDETQIGGLIAAAREHLFRGEEERAESLLRRIEAITPGSVEVSQLRTRHHVWSADLAAAADFLRRTEEVMIPIVRMQRMFLGAFLGSLPIAEIERTVEFLLAKPGPPQRKCFLHQLMAEILASLGHADALAHVVSAVQLPMADLRWFDGCAALAPMRSEPAFLAARAVVARRIELAFVPPVDEAETLETHLALLDRPGAVPTVFASRVRYRR
ncbi:MAG: serine/threonine protein kinase [Deltaproteobacteria bacterium]|nr:serine/threonine protein kinase [Deltaproteobacteria bacterium]